MQAVNEDILRRIEDGFHSLGDPTGWDLPPTFVLMGSFDFNGEEALAAAMMPTHIDIIGDVSPYQLAESFANGLEHAISVRDPRARELLKNPENGQYIKPLAFLMCVEMYSVPMDDYKAALAGLTQGERDTIRANNDGRIPVNALFPKPLEFRILYAVTADHMIHVLSRKRGDGNEAEYYGPSAPLTIPEDHEANEDLIKVLVCIVDQFQELEKLWSQKP